MQKVKELSTKEMQQINGGGSFGQCVPGAIGAGLVGFGAGFAAGAAKGGPWGGLISAGTGGFGAELKHMADNNCFQK